MNNYIKTLIVAIAILAILIGCKATTDANAAGESEGEYMIATYDLDLVDMVIDTIPDPNPDEPEYPGEEPEEEIPLPEEDPDPIPDTIGIWKMN